DMMIIFLFFFFFSSRRRHTRFSRDWSSDVCSSDLQAWNGDRSGYRTAQRSGVEHRLMPTLEIRCHHIERQLQVLEVVWKSIRQRSEERRVGKECRCGGPADHYKKKASKQKS